MQRVREGGLQEGGKNYKAVLQQEGLGGGVAGGRGEGPGTRVSSGVPGRRGLHLHYHVKGMALCFWVPV